LNALLTACPALAGDPVLSYGDIDYNLGGLWRRFLGYTFRFFADCLNRFFFGFELLGFYWHKASFLLFFSILGIEIPPR